LVTPQNAKNGILLRIPIKILTIARSRRDLLFLLNRFVDINKYLYRTRKLPDLYRTNVRYTKEKYPPGQRPVENWQCVDVLYKTGLGDCEDLATARVAWLQVHGEKARIRITKRRPGRIWHVTVKRADGSVEDPSEFLGMT
jgi:hypothetical protein